MAGVPKGTGWVVMFQDEAVFGLRTNISKCLIFKSIRAIVKASQRFGAFKMYGAVNPETGQKVMMRAEKCDTDTFRRHLLRIAARHPGQRVLLVLDNAAWHSAKGLQVPENITLAFLPPYCPELNPVENLWKEMKKELKNQSFGSLEEIYRKIAKWLRRCVKTIQSVCGFKWILEAIKKVRTSGLV